jgi:hypothetical protein
MFFLYSQIYLDQLSKTYVQIVTIEPTPTNENDSYLCALVARIQMPSVSAFHTMSRISTCSSCVNAMIASKIVSNHELYRCNNTPYLEPSQLSHLFQFLYLHNYKIEKEVSKIMKSVLSNDNGRKLLCVIHKNEHVEHK